MIPKHDSTFIKSMWNTKGKKKEKATGITRPELLVPPGLCGHLITLNLREVES